MIFRLHIHENVNLLINCQAKISLGTHTKPSQAKPT